MIAYTLPAAPGEWVIERNDGVDRTVMPLAGWGVTADGDLVALPVAATTGWVVRPRVPSDQAAIEKAASGLRLGNPFGSSADGIDDERTGLTWR